jgi:2-amino-4-hydroxy-6-hydroxymethyldihydropteridine diphosphokinase
MQKFARLSEFRAMETGRMFIGLGGNVGDRQGFFASARSAMEAAWGAAVGASALYETPAWGMAPGTPPFLNQVLAFVAPVGVPPESVLDFMLDVEAALGRVRSAGGLGYENRTIDLDLLLLEGFLAPHQSARLTVPHPRIAERRFVLQPLADIDPMLRVAGHDLTVGELLAKCPDDATLTRIDHTNSESWANA